MIHRLIRLFKDAGAKSEDATARDGAFSYHAETHAVAVGIAAGFFAVATGRERLLGLVYGAAVAGEARGMDESHKRRRILLDCKQEPHYALAGAVVGGLLGAVVRVATGEPLPSLTGVLPL
jgi:hypothetical protein